MNKLVCGPNIVLCLSYNVPFCDHGYGAEHSPAVACRSDVSPFYCGPHFPKMKLCICVSSSPLLVMETSYELCRASLVSLPILPHQSCYCCIFLLSCFFSPLFQHPSFSSFSQPANQSLRNCHLILYGDDVVPSSFLCASFF